MTKQPFCWRAAAADRFLRGNDKFARRLDPQISVLIIQGPQTDKRYVEVPECGHVLLGMNKLKPLVTDSITSFLNEQAFRHKVATA